MAPREPKSEKPPLAGVEDVDDLSSLWIDTGAKDALTETVTTVKLGKPKDFFRTHPSPDMRRKGEIVAVKPEGAFEEQIFIVGPKMRGKIPEAQPATLVTIILRDGSVRIWPLKCARQDERNNDAWVAQRAAARDGLSQWTKIKWISGAYAIKHATPGYAPDPDWSKVGTFEELVRAAVGTNGIILDDKHPVYRNLVGLPPVGVAPTSDDDDL